MSSVVLECVSEGARLRMRIQSYEGRDGDVHHNVYNHEFNCQFPKALRARGRRFRVPAANVSLRGGGARKHFYNVRPEGFSIIDDGAAAPASASSETGRNVYVYASCVECAVCLAAPSSVVFIPCGHLACCEACGVKLRNCCICRTPISNTVRATGEHPVCIFN